MRKPELLSAVWQRFHLESGAKPFAGAAGVAAAVTAIAMEIGVGELAVGLLAGYATYRMLRFGVPFERAVAESIDLERGELAAT